MSRRHNHQIRRLVVFLVTLGLAIANSPVSSQIFSALPIIGGSLAIDRAGNELRESIDKAHAAADALLGKADGIAEEHLQQLDKILLESTNRLIDQSETTVLEILNQAKKDIENLEKEILKDVKSVIWEVECASSRTLIANLGVAMGGLGDLLSTNQIRLTPPRRVLQKPEWYTGCFWWCKDPYVVDITEPFGETYIRVRDLMEGAIEAEHVNDETPASSLVGTYEYLSTFATRTSCFYKGSEERYNREHIKYNRMAKQWNSILNVELQ